MATIQAGAGSKGRVVCWHVRALPPGLKSH